jgi:ABC-type polysaccharide/polyol phosphate transport system ATPase subunit
MTPLEGVDATPTVVPKNSVAPADMAIEAAGVWKQYKLYDDFIRGPVKERLFPWRAEKYYRRFAALRDISFSVQRGQVVGIIGANGSGKTTLLKCIAGLLPIDSGTITVNGRITTLLATGVGVHPEFSGRENIFFNGLMLGMKRAQIQEKLDSIIEFSELGDYIDRPLRTYSSGMRARLLFSISMSVDPDIMIIDEALAAGDNYFVRKCERRLREICASGATVLFVSHSAGQVEELCNHAILMEQGRIIEQGRPFDVARRYNAWTFEKEKEQFARELAAEQQKTSEAAAAEGLEAATTEGLEAATTEEAEQPVQAAKRVPSGSGEIAIDRITLHDSTGNEALGFYTGDPMAIRLHYRCTRGPVARVRVFCAFITRPEGKFVSEMDTSWYVDQIPGTEKETVFDLDGTGIIELRLEPMLLLNNDYSLWIKLYTKEGIYNEICDYHDVAPFVATRRILTPSRGPIFWQPLSFNLLPATGEASEVGLVAAKVE